MFNRGHQFQDFLVAIQSNGGVPCQKIPDLFFPEDIPDPEIREHAIRTAKAICATCPLRLQCFEYATTTGEPYGIWAGTLPHER